MKKILALLLAAVMLVSLAACGSNSPAPEEPEDAEAPVIGVENPTEPDAPEVEPTTPEDSEPPVEDETPETPAEPEETETPAQPAASTQPAAPAKPAAPTQPAAPQAPAAPAKPAAPSQPAAPQQPTAPQTPAAPAQPAAPEVQPAAPEAPAVDPEPPVSGGETGEPEAPELVEPGIGFPSIGGFGGLGGGSESVSMPDAGSLVTKLSGICEGNTGDYSTETFGLSSSSQFTMYFNAGTVTYTEGTAVAVQMPIIGSIPHVVLLIDPADGMDVSEFASQLRTNANPRWQVCVVAESVQVSTKNGLILMVMSTTEIADAVVAAFQAS